MSASQATTTTTTTGGKAGRAVTVPAVEVGIRIVVEQAAGSPTSRQRITQLRSQVLPRVGTLAQAALARLGGGGGGRNGGPRNVRTGTKVIQLKQ